MSINVDSITDIYFNELRKMSFEDILRQTNICSANFAAARKKNKYGISMLHLLAFNRVDLALHPYIAKVKDKEGNTPLHIYAINGQTDIVLRHEKAGRVKNKEGDTPLHLLAKQNYCTQIIDHPDVLRVKNKTGKTPLDILIEYKNKEVLNHKDVSKPLNWKGTTILHKAAAVGMAEVINHPEVHLVREYRNGYTPLHVLAITGESSCLLHTSHRDVTDYHQLTPFDYYANSFVSPANIERHLNKVLN